MLIAVLTTLVLVLGTAALLLSLMVGSNDSDNTDPHGYFAIFSVVGLIVLLVPFLLLVSAAQDLRRHKRAGFGWGAAAGVPLFLVGSVLQAPGIVLILLGIGLFACGIAGLSATRPRPGPAK